MKAPRVRSIDVPQSDDHPLDTPGRETPPVAEHSLEVRLKDLEDRVATLTRRVGQVDDYLREQRRSAAQRSYCSVCHGSGVVPSMSGDCFACDACHGLGRTESKP